MPIRPGGNHGQKKLGKVSLNSEELRAAYEQAKKECLAHFDEEQLVREIEEGKTVPMQEVIAELEEFIRQRKSKKRKRA